VTTEDPGVEGLRKSNSSDMYYGIRMCIGGSSYDWWAAPASATLRRPYLAPLRCCSSKGCSEGRAGAE
jgi:hypothetical protein